MRKAKESFQDGVQLDASKAQFLNEVIAKWKMKVNWGKTKKMVVQRGGGTCHIVVDEVRRV